MHEMSLCESILSILEDEAERQDFTSIKKVCLEIGDLAGVELEALRFGFEVVMRGSLAEGATLEIRRIPGEAWCMQCSKTVETRQRFDACPDCGSHQLQVTGGEDLRVSELEVE